MGVPPARDHGKEPRHGAETVPNNDHRRYMQSAGTENLRGGAACFLWATFPNIAEGIRVLEAWGFQYKTAAFVWVKKNAKSGTTFGAWAPIPAPMRRCACWACPQALRPGSGIRSHKVHQIIEAPFEGHSKKPDETRRRIVELLGDVPRLEMFARQRAEGWDAWGNEVPPEERKIE